MLLPPYGEGIQVRFIRRWIQTKRFLPGPYPLGHEILIGRHFHRIGSDLLHDLGRDDDHPVRVADDNIARKHRCVTTTDRDVDVDRLMQGDVGRRGRPLMITRHIQAGDFRRVAKPAVGDDAGHATHHQPGHQDTARRGRPSVLAAVHDEHGARRALLHRATLRVVVIPEHGHWVQVLTRRHVAQRVSLPHHAAALRSAQRADILDHLVLQATLVEGAGQGCGADALQFIAGFLTQHRSILNR